MKIQRRAFLGAAVGAAAGGTTGLLRGEEAQPAATPVPASTPVDPTALVPLGKHLKVCRISWGTGMGGSRRASNQTRMGQEKFTALMNHAYDHGIRMIDMADMYGSHPFVAEALKDKPRDSYQLVTKMWTQRGGLPEAERPPADVVVARFLKELKAEYIDLVQIHCLSAGNWREQSREYMDGLEKLKEKGLIRAHGVSVHSIAAMEAAVDEPWVDVIHARINPFGRATDGPMEKVVPLLKKMHDAGKGVIAMKVAGEGRINAAQRKESLAYVLAQGCVDAMTVGFEATEHMDEFLTNCREALQAKA